MPVCVLEREAESSASALTHLHGKPATYRPKGEVQEGTPELCFCLVQPRTSWTLTRVDLGPERTHQSTVWIFSASPAWLPGGGDHGPREGRPLISAVGPPSLSSAVPDKPGSGRPLWTHQRPCGPVVPVVPVVLLRGFNCSSRRAPPPPEKNGGFPLEESEIMERRSQP